MRKISVDLINYMKCQMYCQFVEVTHVCVGRNVGAAVYATTWTGLLAALFVQRRLVRRSWLEQARTQMLGEATISATQLTVDRGFMEMIRAHE